MTKDKNYTRDLAWEDVIEVPEGVDKAAAADVLSRYGSIVSRKDLLQAAADGIPVDARTKLEVQLQGAWSGAGAIGKLDGSFQAEKLPEDASLEDVASASASACASIFVAAQEPAKRLQSTYPEDPTDEFRLLLAEQSQVYFDELLLLATRTKEPTPIEIEACGAALDKVGEADDDARAPLLAALRRHLGFWLGESISEGAIHPLDDALARYLETNFGDPGELAAAAVRQGAAERMAAYTGTAQQIEAMLGKHILWKLWVLPSSGPPIVQGLVLLARAAWAHEVRGKVEAERAIAAKHAPGVTMELFGRLADRHRKSRGIEVTAEGFKTTDDDGQHVHLADLPAEVPLSLLEGAPRALAAIHTYDMAVWAITQGAREAFAQPKQGSAGRWRFEGGKHVAALVQGLETIDRPNPAARKEIQPDVARAYEKATIALFVPFPDPYSPGGVLSLAAGSYTRGRGRRPAIIGFDLAGWALPGDVYDRMGGGHNARARELGKIVPLPTGRPKLLAQRYKNREGEALIGSIAGPSAWFYARTVGAIRMRAADVARGYGAYLPRRKLAELARQAGLDPKWLDALLDLWLDGDDGPADLEKMGKDRYHVGPRHGTARLNIDQEGRKEADGARGKPPARKRGKSKKN